MKRLALLLTLMASLGCATLPPCPARGGPTWTRWTSTHFSLFTDLDTEDARSALHDLEELRAAVLLAAWRRAPEPAGRTVVFDLRGWRERLVFVPAGYDASFVPNPPLHEGFIVKSGNDRDALVTETLVLALADHYGLRGKAAWFDEGLYRYLGPLHVAPDGKVTYGQVDPQLFSNATHGRLTSFENIWQEPAIQDRAQFQATTWLVVHYLFNHEATRFAAFQRQLIVTRDARAAWREVFPDLTPEVMDERLSAYVFREGEFATYEAQLPGLRYEVASAPLDDADVHAVRGLLYATTEATPAADRPARARAEVAEALRLDPTQVLAVYVQRFFLHDDETDLERPKQLVARHPDNSLAWLVLARARAVRHETAEAAEALEQVRALAGGARPAVDLDVRVARPD
ncbi:MAG TPA: hypothetical protein VK989_03235 [Polyangia bacterium]|nr:hypothetical protein [Polyangia bacterium]